LKILIVLNQFLKN